MAKQEKEQKKKSSYTPPTPFQQEAGLVKIIYFMMAVSTILMFVPINPLPVISMLLLLLIALFGHYKLKFDENSPLFTHYQWLIRTLWIGLGVFLPGATVLAFGITWKYSDKSAIQAIFNAPDSDDAFFYQALETFQKANAVMAVTIFAIFWGMVFAWVYTRLWRGFKGLQSGPGFQFKNVRTWWV